MRSVFVVAYVAARARRTTRLDRTGYWNARDLGGRCHPTVVCHHNGKGVAEKHSGREVNRLKTSKCGRLESADYVRDLRGNRGRQAAHRIGAATRKQVRALAGGMCAGCNQHHLTDLLAEREGIGVSRSTVRRILQKEGISSPRTHRVATHRSRRERYPKEGMLVQIDGSPHAWLGDRGPASVSSAASTMRRGQFRRRCFGSRRTARGICYSCASS